MLSTCRPPRDLDSKACVTIGDQVSLHIADACSVFCKASITSASVQNFVVKADDLEQIEELGRGAYGVVDKMKHVPTNVIMAVKVS